MDEGVDTKEDLEDADMGKIFCIGRECSFKPRFVDARCCTSVLDNESIVPFGIPGSI